MATLVPLTLRQANDEIIDLVITPSDPLDDLSLITSLTVIIKPDKCTSDTDATAFTLTTTDPTEVVITTQTSAIVEAILYMSATVLAAPYDRWWRVDAYVGTARRTAMYGPITLVDL